tara:strand:- start:5158 stop:5802 length:645 start_codon:yes stop_codon:yes gene_type:complete
MRVLKLNIDEVAVKYKLPTRWSEVSLEQYSKLMLVLESDSNNEIEAVIKTLEALAGIDVSTLSKVPLKQLKAAYNELSLLTSTMPNSKIKRVIDVDGLEFGFIPDFDELSLGEFVDLDNYLQDAWNNLDKIMAVLYRGITKREGDKYQIEPYSLDDIKDRRELFKRGLSIDTIYGAMVFFCNTGSKFIKTMQLSLEKESKELKERRSSKLQEIL